MFARISCDQKTKAKNDVMTGVVAKIIHPYKKAENKTTKIYEKNNKNTHTLTKNTYT